jgi:repressor LexA
MDENTGMDVKQPEPAMKHVALTPRQQQVFDLVQDAIERTGAPPTRAEIAAQLGFRSANAAEEHLQALARKGAIELLGGTSRGIRLKSDTLRALRSARADDGMAPPALLAAAALSLPLVGRVAAGSPILAQEHIDQYYQVSPALFPMRPDYLLRVRGMSMRDAGILDGDLLAVQKAGTVRNGQIVVARLGDEVTVKRFQHTRNGIELLPENPEFHPIHVAPGRVDFALEGVAVGLIRNSPLM